MPPVRRHRIGDQMPAITHAGPDPNAIALCQDLMAQAPVDCAILFGSRALGGWDDQSDLDIIVIHQAAGDDAQEPSLVGLAINQLRQLHYPGYLAYESPHHEVMHGLMLRHRTITAPAAAPRTTSWPGPPGRAWSSARNRTTSTATATTATSPTSGSWSPGSGSAARPVQTACWPTSPGSGPRVQSSKFNVNTVHGRNAHWLLWNSGAALLSILGAVYPRDSMAEMARSIAQHDAGWSHIFQSDLDRIDQYSDCGCEVVVTDPIDDVLAMRQDLQVDRDALWERIRDLSGYDLTLDPAGAPPTS